MDSLNRLNDSIDQALDGLTRLRRENAELKLELERQAQKDSHELAQARAALEQAKSQLEGLRNEPGHDVASIERAEKAELEASTLAQKLEEVQNQATLKEENAADRIYAAEEARDRAQRREADLEARLKTLQQEQDAGEAQLQEEEDLRSRFAEKERDLQNQLILLADQRDTGNRIADDLRARIDELELKLAASLTQEEDYRKRAIEMEELLDQATSVDDSPPKVDPEVEKALQEARNRVENLSKEKAELELKIAETATPDEVSGWQGKIQKLELRCADFEQQSELWREMDTERQVLRKEKRALASVKREREDVRRKLQEIYSMLENLRL